MGRLTAQAGSELAIWLQSSRAEMSVALSRSSRTVVYIMSVAKCNVEESFRYQVPVILMRRMSAKVGENDTVSTLSFPSGEMCAELGDNSGIFLFHLERSNAGRPHSGYIIS
jgi:hypothetical protein